MSTVLYNGVFAVNANDTNKLSVNTASLQGLFADADAGVNKDVFVSGISITGSASSNYQLSGGNSLVVAGTITPAPLTITGGNASHVFNNTTRTNTFSVTSGTLYGSDSVTGVAGLGTGIRANTTATPVYADTLSAATGNGIGNYAVTYVNGGLTITRAPLTALATPNATTYSGGTSVANTTALSGVIAGTTVSGTTSLVMGSPNAGTQTITNNGTTLSGDFATDYEVVSSNLVGTTPNQVTPSVVSSGNGGGTIMVAKAPLTIAGATNQVMYDGSAKTNTASVTGAANGETITTSGNAVARNVGDVVADSLQAVAGSGVDLNNYAITFVPGSLEITPAPFVAAPAIEKPADAFILPPTPPVFVAPLDRISDVLANVNGIRLSPANEPAGQPGACSADSAVLFGEYSDVLTDEAKEKLRQCCAKNQPITLSGLRGAEGAGQFNIDLGKRRAQAVRRFIENTCQMPQAGQPGKPQ